MFQVIDELGYVYDAYGTFVDECGDVQFILCDTSCNFYKTTHVGGYFKLYKGNEQNI